MNRQPAWSLGGFLTSWAHWAIILAFSILSCLVARAADDLYQKEWLTRSDKQNEADYIGEFRDGHNFALGLNSSRAYWQIEDFGDNKNHSFGTTGTAIKFQYSYHIPLFKRFGFFLGSSVGYYLARNNPDEPINLGYSFQLPGVLAGFALTLSPAFRAGIGFDTYLERIDSLKTQSGDTAKLEVTFLTYPDFFAFLDIFYSVNWAVRLEGHYRWTQYISPRNSVDTVLGASFARKETSAGFGLAYHIL